MDMIVTAAAIVTIAVGLCALVVYSYQFWRWLRRVFRARQERSGELSPRHEER